MSCDEMMHGNQITKQNNTHAKRDVPLPRDLNDQDELGPLTFNLSIKMNIHMFEMV